MPRLPLTALRSLIGKSGFYSKVAELDGANAAAWQRMARVQETFAAGEKDYGKDALVYSESMRETLHLSVIHHFEQPSLLAKAQASDGGLMGQFVRLHPTAFKANGACHLGVMDMMQVAYNTHSSMYNARNARWLADGLANDEPYDMAREAADEVRAKRSAQGKPVTTDGYD